MNAVSSPQVKLRFLAPLLALLAAGATVEVRALERVGEVVRHHFETSHPYRGPGEVATAQLVLSETLHHEGASYIAVHFESFRLAAGDRVVVRSPDGRQSWSYSGLGRAGMGMSPGGFWATHIRGESAVVELFSRHDRGDHGFVIDRFARGYADLERRGGFESICTADDSEWARCYEGSEPIAYERGKSVSRMLINGLFTCTGWLVGCEGHLMTNNHCIVDQSVASNTDYEFMAEGANCATDCSSDGACPGTIAATNATLVKTNAFLDYTLLKLPFNLSQSYGYLQLRETPAVADERIYIPQHPDGWGKRIAMFSSHPQDVSGFCEIDSIAATPCTGGPAGLGYYCDTQVSSSGSPVLAEADHRVVGLHHCGSCPNRATKATDLIAHIGADLPQCTTPDFVGTVEIDAASYSCTGEVAVTIRDDSLQGLPSQAVTVDSDSEAGGESVTLLAEAPGSAIFSGTVPLTAAPAVGGDGSLSVADGDTLTVTYVDADDGSGGIDLPRQTSAGVDCAAPAISAVTASGITGTGAEVSWTTDEPATSGVTFGEAPPGSTTVEDPSLVTAHSVSLDGLLECRVYAYSVSSADAVGNLATDDDGGAYYSFETPCTAPPSVNGLTVERASADGSALRIYWDNQCVFAPATGKILFGALDAVSLLEPDGAVCGIPRLASPRLWSPAPAGSLWFLMSGDNGFGQEGSWGLTSSGTERAGTNPSGECGAGVKNLTGSCP